MTFRKVDIIFVVLALLVVGGVALLPSRQGGRHVTGHHCQHGCLQLLQKLLQAGACFTAAAAAACTAACLLRLLLLNALLLHPSYLMCCRGLQLRNLGSPVEQPHKDSSSERSV